MFNQAKHTFNQGMNTVSYQLGFIGPVRHAAATIQENIRFHLDQAKDFCLDAKDLCVENVENAVGFIGEHVHNTLNHIFDSSDQ